MEKKKEAKTKVVKKEFRKIDLFVETVNKLKVNSMDSLTTATELLKSKKDFDGFLNEEYDGTIKKLHDLHKDELAKKKRFTVPLNEAEKVLKNNIGTYQMELQKTENERIRKEQIEIDKAEAKRKKELERQATEHEKKGNTEKAEVRRSQAEQVIFEPPAESTIPKTHEIGSSKLITINDIEVRITDPRKALEFILKHDLTPGLDTIEFKMGKLKTMIKNQGISTPGNSPAGIYVKPTVQTRIR